MITTRRKLVPPRDPAKRRRYYGLMGKAKTAPPHQRAHLLQLARGLMTWADTEEVREATPPRQELAP
jgi:hypothetical protein